MTSSSIIRAVSLLAAFLVVALAVGCSGEDPDGTDALAADGGVDAGVVAVPLEGCLGVNAAEVTVGGAQKLHVIIDTGSTTVAIAGSRCPSCTAAGVSPLYEPGPGAVDREKQASSLYGTGDHGWTGAIYQDAIRFEGLPDTRVDFVSIEAEKSFFFPTWCLPHGYQGIFGLGPAAAALPGTDSYLDRLAATSGLPDVFAVRFCDSRGTLWFGGYDSAAATGPPVYVPLLPTNSSAPLYAVELTGFSVGSKPVGAPAASFGSTIVDTGSDAVYLPEALFSPLASAIGERAAFTQIFPGGSAWLSGTTLATCTVVAETKAELDAALPPLTLSFGGVEIEAPATESYLTAVEGLASTRCWVPGIATNPGLPYRIIGTSFLRSRITIFDRQSQRLGFVPRKPCS